MAIETETREVTYYTCDGCGNTTVEIGTEVPLGIRGNAFEVSLGGGDGNEFWVCSRKCLRKGIEAALDRPTHER